MEKTLTLPIDPNSSVVQETVKVTTGYFTGGAGKLMGTDIYTGSIDDGNKAYYVNLTQVHPDSSSAETQFSVAYGHIDGSGSFTDSDQVVGASELIYKQWGSFLLSPTAITLILFSIFLKILITLFIDFTLLTLSQRLIILPPVCKVRPLAITVLFNLSLSFLFPSNNKGIV